jgi:hypothetical protein
MSHRNWITVFVLTLSLCLTAASADAKGTGKGKGSGSGKSKSHKGSAETLVSGVIESLAADGRSFVFQPKTGGKRESAMTGGEPLRLTMTAGTTVSVDGATAKTADLRAGMHAKLRYAGSYTSSIQAFTPAGTDQKSGP